MHSDNANYNLYKASRWFALRRSTNLGTTLGGEMRYLKIGQFVSRHSL
jgi:hypothetical protein